MGNRQNKRAGQSACADGVHGKEGVLEKISGIRAAGVRELMQGDKYRAEKIRQADECRNRAKDLFGKKKPEIASEMLERAADVYRVLGEMEADQFKRKEFCLTASRLYDEAGWLVAGMDAGRAAQLFVKSGEALECMEGKCAPLPQQWGIISWKNSARVKYSKAVRLLEERSERLSRSTSIVDRRRGIALGQEAAELRKRMDACMGEQVSAVG